MTSTHTVNAQERKAAGTGAARSLRRNNLIPAVVYGGSLEPVALAIDEKQLAQEYLSEGFFNRVLTLKVDNKEHVVLPKEVQLHPVTDRVIHADFQRVDANSRVRVHVPIHFQNEEKCPGVKRGGTLNIVLHSLEVICSPSDIPEFIDADLSTLEIASSLTLSAIELPVSVKSANPTRDNVLATIVGAAKEATTEAS